jgi:hypothetical protein
MLGVVSEHFPFVNKIFFFYLCPYNSMSKTIKLSQKQLDALTGLINDSIPDELECLADQFRDCGEHELADEIEDDNTSDERRAELCKEYGEIESTWYQLYLLLPLIKS